MVIIYIPPAPPPPPPPPPPQKKYIYIYMGTYCQLPGESANGTPIKQNCCIKELIEIFSESEKKYTNGNQISNAKVTHRLNIVT